MAFSKAADGRIAGHFADRLDLVGGQKRICAKARGRRRRFAARMSTAHNDNVKILHDKHNN